MSDSDSIEPADGGPQEADPKAEAEAKDLVLVGDRCPRTGGYRVLRQREDRVEVGELHAMREGQPLTGDLVRLHPTERHERVFACETIHASAPRSLPAHGPPQIATATYRRHWEDIFGALADSLGGENSDDADFDDPVDVSKLN